jgi:uncharacterized protein (TIGR03435 family)
MLREIVGLILCAGFCTAQTALPAFDVASVKAAHPNRPYPVELGTALHGRVTLTNVTLTQCLRFAYKISNDGQIAGPDWIKSPDSLFNIEAKAPPETSKDQLRLMMQALLAERFGLKLHHEQKEMRYVALLVDKKGLKLREDRGRSIGNGSSTGAHGGPPDLDWNTHRSIGSVHEHADRGHDRAKRLLRREAGMESAEPEGAAAGGCGHGAGGG